MRFARALWFSITFLAVPVSAEAQSSLIPGGNWSGPYFGITAGGASTQISEATKASDFVWSGHYGYGLNVANLYFGAEVDGTWGGARSSYYLTPIYSSATQVDWSATARARVGFTWDNALFYVTGGAAWSGQTVTNYGLGTQLSTGSQKSLGTVIGAGIEVKVLPNIAFRIEGLHYDFSQPALSLNQVPSSIVNSALKGAGDETVIRAGVSIRFN